MDKQLYLQLVIHSTTWFSRRKTYIRRLINSYYNYLNGIIPDIENLRPLLEDFVLRYQQTT